MLALCDRAFEFLAQRGCVTEAELLSHVYGGAAPQALWPKLIAPLLADPRLARSSDGSWSLAAQPQAIDAFTALGVVASGPNPARAAVVAISALRGAERFQVIVNPGVHVPRYALARLGVEPEQLEAQPTFADILAELETFLGESPVLAQDAQLTWDFIDAEARRLGHILPTPRLLDVNELATRHLALEGKPTLAIVAGRLGIPVVDVKRLDDEVRVLALVGEQLPLAAAVSRSAQVLRRSSTASSLTEEPGVYVLHDAEHTPIYVGKAKRLRSRMAAYVHRPLGATRRLEGLVGSVEGVDTMRCETDLEALVLEDREIRRLQPRFNTVRQQRTPRYWIELPPQRFSSRLGGRPLAPPRLELSLGPQFSDGGEFVGPFRNEALAEAARRLAREVFELDSLRAADPYLYTERLSQAWAFLHGDSSLAEALSRRSTRLLRKVAAFDVRGLLLPEDPRIARYAVIRPTNSGVDGFLLDEAVLTQWTVLHDDVTQFAAALFEPREPRTRPEDRDVVLRWFGSQRRPARLIASPDTDAIEDAALELLEARAAGRDDAFDAPL